MKIRLIYQIFLIAFLVLLFSIIVQRGELQASGMEYPEKNFFAPSFELPSLKGKKIKLSDYRGKVVFINFWATWCIPCKTEMASMEKNMTWISLCIATAPMLGFLGTVWGMIQAFNDIKMANDISPAVVAGGISVALLTTAFGLVVAVILQLFQNAVLYIIDNQIVTLQKSTTTLLHAIKDIIKS